jgi:hypothetical protein
LPAKSVLPIAQPPLPHRDPCIAGSFGLLLAAQRPTATLKA